MGTTTIYRRLTADEAARIKDDPLSAGEIVFPRMAAAPPAPKPAKPKGLLARLFGGGGGKVASAPPAASGPVVDWDRVYKNPNVFDLDKAAEGLHFLLTNGGKPFETETAMWWLCPPDARFLGDGSDAFAEQPMWLIAPEEVKNFYAALEALTPEKMKERFKPMEMMRMPVYPDIWDRDPAEDDALSWLIETRGLLLPFLKETADSGRGLIGCLIF